MHSPSWPRCPALRALKVSQANHNQVLTQLGRGRCGSHVYEATPDIVVVLPAVRGFLYGSWVHDLDMAVGHDHPARRGTGCRNGTSNCSRHDERSAEGYGRTRRPDGGHDGASKDVKSNAGIRMREHGTREPCLQFTRELTFSVLIINAP